MILQDLCPTDLAGHVAMAIDPNIAAIILNEFGRGHPVRGVFRADR